MMSDPALPDCVPGDSGCGDKFLRKGERSYGKGRLTPPPRLSLTGAVLSLPTDDAGLTEDLKNLISTNSDFLRKNEKALKSLEELLKSTSTDNTGDSNVLDLKVPFKFCVELKCSVLQIVDIDISSQQYEAEILLEARWRDPAYRGLKETEFGEVKFEKYWNPGLIICNIAGELDGDSVFQMAIPSYDEHDDATVVMLRKCKGRFSQKFDLQQYPFDTQALSIQIASKKSTNEIQLSETCGRMSIVNVNSAHIANEWDLYSHVEVSRDALSELSRRIVTRPVLTFTVHVSRKSSHLWWNVFLETFIIGLLSFLALVINHGDDDSQRLISIGALILVVLGLRGLKSPDTMKKHTYLSFSDIYRLLCLTYLVLTSIIFAVPHICLDNYSLRWFNDHYAFPIMVTLFFIYHITLGIYIFCTVYETRKQVTQKEEEYKARFSNLLSTNTSSVEMDGADVSFGNDTTMLY